MTLTPLKAEEQAAANGATHVAVFTHADLTEATVNTAQVIAIAGVSAKDRVIGKGMKLITAFEDASDAALNTTTLIVGDSAEGGSGDADRYLASQELNANGTEIWATTPSGAGIAYTVTDTVAATFGSMAAKALNDIDTGKVEIYLAIHPY